MPRHGTARFILGSYKGVPATHAACMTVEKSFEGCCACGRCCKEGPDRGGCDGAARPSLGARRRIIRSFAG